MCETCVCDFYFCLAYEELLGVFIFPKQMYQDGFNATNRIILPSSQTVGKLFDYEYSGVKRTPILKIVGLDC